MEEDDAKVVNSSEVAITMLPPSNACDDLTDEDSGDEDYLSINNLPATQLRAPAEISNSHDDSDEDDNVPLSIVRLGCKKTKNYEWKNEDIEVSQIQWPVFSTVQNRQDRSPVEYFCDFFDDEIIDLFVKYTNLYAAKKKIKLQILQLMK